MLSDYLFPLTTYFPTQSPTPTAKDLRHERVGCAAWGGFVGADFAGDDFVAIFQIVADQLGHDSIGMAGFDFEWLNVSVAVFEPDGADIVGRLGASWS